MHRLLNEFLDCDQSGRQITSCTHLPGEGCPDRRIVQGEEVLLAYADHGVAIVVEVHRER